jgi:Tfp pilus assembly protein PilF
MHRCRTIASRFDEAIRLDPTSAHFMLGRAEAYQRSDQPTRALEDYDKAAALGNLVLRDKARLRAGRGGAYLKLKNYDAAVENFDAALELRPRFIGAMRMRGLAFQAMGKTDRASRDYEAALKMEPGHEWTMKRVQELRGK